MGWVARNGMLNLRGDRTLLTADREVQEKFSWSEVGRAIFSFQTWLTASAYFGILSGLYSLGLFVSARFSGVVNGADMHSSQPSLPPSGIRRTRPSCGLSSRMP